MSHEAEHDWQNGLCGCFSDIGNCCLGTWCPCILYAKTSYRQNHMHDPGMTSYSTCNGDCWAYGALLCLTGCGQQILQCLRRPQLRERTLHVRGSGGKDCLIGWCCSCCALIQEEREVKDAQDGKGVYAAMAQQPGKHDGMTYAAAAPAAAPQHPPVAAHAQHQQPYAPQHQQPYAPQHQQPYQPQPYHPQTDGKTGYGGV